MTRLNARRGRRRDSIELLGVGLRPETHFTRLWPAEPDEQSARTAFLLLMLPVRLALLALLWATSGPFRAVLAITAVIAVFVL